MDIIKIGDIVNCVIVSKAILGNIVQLPDNSTGLMIYTNFNNRLYQPFKGEIFKCCVIRKTNKFIDLKNVE